MESMNKYFRLLREAFFALYAYSNFWTYYRERLGMHEDGTVVIHLRAGVHYKIKTNDSDVRILNEVWNAKVYDRFLPELKPGATIVDIGAQVGVVSIRFAHAVRGAHIFAYEPFGPNFAVLQDNIALNTLFDSVKGFQKAIAGERGTVQFYTHDHDSGGGSLVAHGDPATTRVLQVEAITLADVFMHNHIEQCDLMKIDCEGAEVAILTQAPDDVLARVRRMAIEWHGDRTGMSLPQFSDFLRQRGFAVDFHEPSGTLYAWRT
jgi:FkbM family methyltransferase